MKGHRGGFMHNLSLKRAIVDFSETTTLDIRGLDFLSKNKMFSNKLLISCTDDSTGKVSCPSKPQTCPNCQSHFFRSEGIQITNTLCIQLYFSSSTALQGLMQPQSFILLNARAPHDCKREYCQGQEAHVA